MKKCPFCAKELEAGAIKCLNCGGSLDQGLSPAAAQAPDENVKWYFRTYTLVIIFLSIGPLVLPLIWLRPAWSIKTKIIWTLIIGILSWWMGMATVKAFKAIWDYYQVIFGNIPSGL